MFTRLLVPLDGSHLAEAVLPIVERLGVTGHASVTLLHVLERGAPLEVHGERHLHAEEEATTYLEETAGCLRAAGIPVEYHFHDAPEGDVARSIAAHAEEEHSDLIVLCTHGGGRVRERLFGSIAQRVLNRGTAPVLLARPAEDGDVTPFNPGRILVPLDGTAAAEAALETASGLAAQLNAGLHLVMVVASEDSAHADRPAATLLPAATRAVLDMEQQDATRYLGTLSTAHDLPDVPVSIEVRRGSTASALAEEAAEPGVGLVVLATHGRAGVQAIWAGSVAAQVLTRTKAPVLLLRTVER